MGTKAPRKLFDDPTPEQIEQFETANPDGIETVVTEYGVFMVKGVQRPLWKQYVNMLAEPGKKGDALDYLAQLGRVYPDEATFATVINRKPAIVSAFIGPISELSGQSVAVAEKG